MHSPIQEQLLYGHKKFRKLAKQVRQDPSPDNVHDLRVFVRRLRTRLWLIPKEERSRDIRKLKRSLKKLSDLLGELRKFDIAIEDAPHFHRGTKTLEKRRRQLRRETRQFLPKETRDKLTRLLRQCHWQAAQVPSESIVSRLVLLKSNLVNSLKTIPSSDNDRHRLRIDLKKTRYCLELIDCRIPELEQIQDYLGRWHDFVTLSELLGESDELIQAKREQWRMAARILKPAAARALFHLDELVSMLLEEDQRNQPSDQGDSEARADAH